MHSRWHPCRIRVPRHQIGFRWAFAQQVVLNDTRPDEVVRPQDLEGACHLARIEIPLLRHHVLKQSDLGAGDEQRQFAGLGKVLLGCEQRQRAQAPIAVARHGRGCDREQGSAQTITGCMNRGAAGNRDRRFDRGHHALRQIIVHAQIPVLRTRVSPRDHEDREALRHQITDERVLRRKVEDVVFHDPGGHDQDRLRHNILRHRRVLDQFHQAVAKYHLAGRHGDSVPDCRIGRLFGADVTSRLRHVFREVGQATEEVAARFAHGTSQDERIGQEKIRGRDDVQQLAVDKRHHALVRGGDAANAGRRVMQPLLPRQKALVIRIEGPLLPGRVVEASVSGQWINARRCLAALPRALREIVGVPQRLAPRFPDQPVLRSGRWEKMGKPIKICLPKRGRRQPQRHLRYGGMKRSVGQVSGFSDRIFSGAAKLTLCRCPAQTRLGWPCISLDVCQHDRSLNLRV